MESSMGIAKDLKALGIISSRLQDYEAAYEYYNRALQVLVRLDLARETSAVLAEMITIAERIGKTDEAEALALERARIDEALRSEEAPR
jgi:tetratricopeptide (TPR) repeat protein